MKQMRGAKQVFMLHESKSAANLENKHTALRNEGLGYKAEEESSLLSEKLGTLVNDYLTSTKL